MGDDIRQESEVEGATIEYLENAPDPHLQYAIKAVKGNLTVDIEIDNDGFVDLKAVVDQTAVDGYPDEEVMVGGDEPVSHITDLDELGDDEDAENLSEAAVRSFAYGMIRMSVARIESSGNDIGFEH